MRHLRLVRYGRNAFFLIEQGRSMKHKDGLDIAAVMLPCSGRRHGRRWHWLIAAGPAVLVVAALCVVLYQRRRLRAFVAKTSAARTLRTAASSTA